MLGFYRDLRKIHPHSEDCLTVHSMSFSIFLCRCVRTYHHYSHGSHGMRTRGKTSVSIVTIDAVGNPLPSLRHQTLAALIQNPETRGPSRWEIEQTLSLAPYTLIMTVVDSRDIHEGWTFKKVTAGGASDEYVKVDEEFIAQQFPTTVHVELLKEKRIPDPVSGSFNFKFPPFLPLEIAKPI